MGRFTEEQSVLRDEARSGQADALGDRGDTMVYVVEPEQE